MKTSSELTKLPPALLAAQRAITFAAKNAENGHLRNKYADLHAVIEAVKGPLNEAGVVFVQTSSPSDDGKLHLTTRLIHESGEWLEDTLVLPVPKQDPQGYGSAMTYARRYALAAITGLYQDDDDAESAKPKKQTKAALPESRFRKALHAVAKGEFDHNKLRAQYALTPEQLKALDAQIQTPQPAPADDQAQDQG